MAQMDFFIARGIAFVGQCGSSARSRRWNFRNGLLNKLLPLKLTRSRSCRMLTCPKRARYISISEFLVWILHGKRVYNNLYMIMSPMSRFLMCCVSAYAPGPVGWCFFRNGLHGQSWLRLGLVIGQFQLAPGWRESCLD